MTDMAESLLEIKARQEAFDRALAGHSIEINALRAIAKDTGDGIRTINEKLGDLIRINERQVVQGESIGRAFSQIGNLSGRVDEVAQRVIVLETHNKANDRDREDNTRQVAQIAGQLTEISNQVDSLKQTRQAIAAFGGPLYANAVRTAMAIMMLAISGLVGFVISEIRNENRQNHSVRSDPVSVAVLMRSEPGAGPELPADGRNHERNRRI